MKKYIELLLLPLVFLFASCGDSNKDEPKSPIHKATATGEIDLEAYSDLVCSINSVVYQFAINGKTIVATPKEGGEIANMVPLGEGLAAVTMLLTNRNIASAGQVIDQSTYKKMMYCDVLQATKVAIPNPTSEITGMALEHNFSMLSFTSKNIPEGAVIKVKEGVNSYVVAPYKMENNTYRAISVYAIGAIVEVTVDERPYQIAMGGRPLNKTSLPTRDANHFYTFELEYHPTETDLFKKLSINNPKKETWINQHLEVEMPTP